eukprot:gb/GECG01011929.1/.p1 GENE.gb/GECG01011929.1/~~gb/GECG01011929.1/.p1  ORF type:complete len:151 (+),score=11.00 gb/GECG01011929.1/:1-453(+)
MMGILRRHGPPVGSVGGCLLVLFLIWTLSTALMAHATGNNQHAEDAGLSTGSVAYLRKTGEGSPDAEEQSSEGGPTEKQLDKTFDKIDSDNSGKIDRKEFKWFARGNIEGVCVCVCAVCVQLKTAGQSPSRAASWTSLLGCPSILGCSDL